MDDAARRRAVDNAAGRRAVDNVTGQRAVDGASDQTTSQTTTSQTTQVRCHTGTASIHCRPDNIQSHLFNPFTLSYTANVLPDEELTKSRQRAAGKMPQDTAGNASDDAQDTAGNVSNDAAQPGKEGVKLWSDGFLQSRIKKRKDESWQVESSLESSLESSRIADVLDELRGIPEREAGGEQLDARVAELIDELEEHLAKLKEENNRLLAVAFGLLTWTLL